MRVTVRGGVRQTTGAVSLDWTPNAPTLVTGTTNYSATTYSAGATVKATDWMNLRVGAASGFRAPTATELGANFTTVRQYQNVGNATFQGLELIATWQPFEQLRLTGGFTSTNAYLTSSVNPTLVRTGVQLGQVPGYMFTAGVEWRPIETLVLTAALKSFPQYWNDTNHPQLNDGATLIDLGLRWTPVKDVDIYGSIQNLTNVQYLAQGYTRTSFEGSTVSASAIPQLGMPLTATAGLRVKF